MAYGIYEPNSGEFEKWHKEKMDDFKILKEKNGLYKLILHEQKQKRIWKITAIVLFALLCISWSLLIPRLF